MKLWHLCDEMKKKRRNPLWNCTSHERKIVYQCRSFSAPCVILLLAMMGTGTTLATVATLGALATGTCGTLLIAFGLLDEHAV